MTNAEAEFSKTWGWFNAIDELAKNDVLKYDLINKQPMNLIFSKIMMQNDKVKMLKNAQRELMNRKR